VLHLGTSILFDRGAVQHDDDAAPFALGSVGGP